MANNKLTKIILDLMNDSAQSQRPAQERGKHMLEKGLHLWLKRVGPIWVLSLSRNESVPSEREVETVAEAIKAIQRPAASLVFCETIGTKHITGSGFRGARYICWTHHPVRVMHPPEIKQSRMFGASGEPAAGKTHVAVED
jgi:hypothetical protein